MEMEFVRELQAYGYIIGIMFCTIMLYGYIYHIYKSEKKGINNYEKYANIALDDELDSAPIETTSPWDKKK
jgi:cytochrome c oxidase cbb3-type subunit 4